jgi:hypothetical protein
MVKNVGPFFGAQDMPHIKGLPTFESLGIICIGWETWWGVYCLTNLLRASTNVSEGATFVERPAVNMILVMQLIKNFEPVVQVRVSPAWLHNSVCLLIRIRIKR